MASRLVSLTISTLAIAGCALPCLDDGLGQKYCPPDEAADQADQTSDELDATAEANETSSCSLFDVVLIPQTPTVVLLVDQSGSMETEFGSGTRWTTVYDVLVGQGGVVPQYEAGIRFGISLYTSIDGNTTGMECPILTEVAPALDNLAPIQTLLDANGPSGETPRKTASWPATSKTTPSSPTGSSSDGCAPRERAAGAQHHASRQQAGDGSQEPHRMLYHL